MDEQNIMPFEVLNKQIKINTSDILEELRHSLEHQNVIGILVKDTHEMITTAITGIEPWGDSSDYIVQLLDQDLHGYPIDRTELLLSNIDRVIHFNISFDDPQYVKVRRKEKFKA
jgi:hypothetical protein